jgi:hypothetical protein
MILLNFLTVSLPFTAAAYTGTANKGHAPETYQCDKRRNGRKFRKLVLKVLFDFSQTKVPSH